MSKVIMTINLNRDADACLKENNAERAERLKYASAMQTKIIPNKKHYNRKKLKKVCENY